jgi:hypothetical protein
MVLFDNFCYATIQDAVNVEISKGAVSYGNYLASPTSYTVINDTTVNLMYMLSNGYPDVLQRTYGICTDVGVYQTYSGLTYTTLTQMLGGVILCWLIAFGVKSAVETMR